MHPAIDLAGIRPGRIIRGPEDARPVVAIEGLSYIAADTGRSYFYKNAAWTVVGIGPDRCTVGPFSDANYIMSTPLGRGNNPTLANPSTLAIGFYVHSLPGTGGGLLNCFATDASFLNGYYLGNSTVNSNKFRLAMVAVNSSGANEINATMVVGPNVLALNYSGSAIRYSLNGAAVGNISCSGTYTLPDLSGSRFILGRWVGPGFPATWASIAWARAYSAAVSDSDLQTLSGSPTTYLPPVISAAPSYDFQARWFVGGEASYPTGGSSPSALVLTGALFKTAR